MKIRNGFVSNSSSSSFIVALKKVNIPMSIIKGPDFLDMVEQSEHRITQDTIDYMDNEQDWIAKYRDNEEWTVAHITISNHDEDTRKILYNMVGNGDAEILYSTEN